MPRSNRNSGRAVRGSRDKPRTVRKHRTARNTQHTCRGKVRYRDKPEAERALHLIQAHSTRERQAARAYRCDQCKGFHLTSWHSHPDME